MSRKIITNTGVKPIPMGFSS